MKKFTKRQETNGELDTRYLNSKAIEIYSNSDPVTVWEIDNDIIRDECGTILNLVMFDTDSRKKYLVSAPANAGVLFGSYPLYNEKTEVIGNKGLVILEKRGTAVKLITCAGFFVEDGVEDQIIDKTQRLNMRVVNAAVLTDRDEQKYIFTL